MSIIGEKGKIKKGTIFLGYYDFYFIIIAITLRKEKTLFIGIVYGNIAIPFSDPVQSMGDLPSSSELSMEQRLM